MQGWVDLEVARLSGKNKSYDIWSFKVGKFFLLIVRAVCEFSKKRKGLNDNGGEDRREGVASDQQGSLESPVSSPVWDRAN